MRSSNIFARGDRAYGFCDRCDQRFPVGELQWQWVNRQRSGLKVCEECLDIDHEQLRTNELPSHDAIALRDPRPDKNLDDSRGLWGWSPARGTDIVSSLGNVRITV